MLSNTYFPKDLNQMNIYCVNTESIFLSVRYQQYRGFIINGPKRRLQRSTKREI